ncbi:MAG: ABC-2 transporter permease [Solirubrobacterales bacterium]
MINLVVKDMRLIKKATILGMLYTLVITVVSLKSSFIIQNLMYCFLIVCMTYISVLYADGYDETNKGYLVLASLPIKRHIIVRAKYLSLLVYFAAYAITPMIMLTAVSLSTGNGLKIYSPYAVISAFVILGIIYSIYYPLYYKFGYSALKIYKIVVFFIIIMLPRLILLMSEAVKRFSPSTVFILIPIAMAFIFISLLISVSVYEKKELI